MDLCYYADIRSSSMCDGDYSNIECTEHDKGVYIFFKEKSKEIIYIGESHKNRGKWSVFCRLQQHFQQSQSSGILYKCMHKYCNQNEQNALDWFRINEVKIGYIPMNDKDPDYISKVEKFLIYIFKPEFNYTIKK